MLLTVSPTLLIVINIFFAILVHADGNVEEPPEPKTEEMHDQVQESQAADYDIEESIDLGSLKSLHRASSHTADTEKDTAAVDLLSVTDSHNVTYLTANKNEKGVTADEAADDKSNTPPVHTTRSINRMKDPVGCSTPNCRSPERGEKELKRRSFPLPFPTTVAAPAVVQSGKGTYFVKGSSHHHRRASELFLESNSSKEGGALEQVHVEPDRRPLSEVVFSGGPTVDNEQLCNRTTFGTIPNRNNKSNFSRRESAAANEEEEDLVKNENQQNEARESLKSVRAEMEMKRREIQKQRAHEDREKRKQRQKVSEAAFFKAIQPRSQSAINIESYQNMDDGPCTDTDRYNTFSNNTRNPSVSDMSIQTSIEVSHLGGGGSGGQHGLNPTSPDDDREPMFSSGHLGAHNPQYYGDNVAERDLHRTTSLDW